MDRRRMLAGLLGIPALLSGCRRDTKEKPPQFSGKIIGPTDKLGHRLRKDERPTPAADAWERCGVAIVGGGIAGLAAAWRLQKAGFHDFTLLEMEPRSGGTSASGASDVSAFPWAAHYVPVPMKENAALVALLDEMGILEGRDAEGEPIVAEQFLCRDPQERVFYKGRWYEGLYLYAGATAADRAQLQAFQAEMDRWAAWRDAQGRRAFALPIAAGSDDAEVTALDRLDMRAWLLKHGWTSPRLHWLVDYCCRDDYGTKSEQTSAWAGVFYFASRVRRPGTKSQPLITWPEGNGRIVAHFYEQVKSRVRLGWMAAEIVPKEDGIDVVMLDASGAVRGIRARQVIFAAPQFVAQHVIRDFRSAPPKHIAQFDYVPWLVANLVLHDRPRSLGFPPAWDNVLYESPSLGYVTATHQSGIDDGPAVLTYYHAFADDSPRDARAELLNMDWSDCADMILADLERAHPEIGRLVDRLDVMRWGHAMVRPRPGFVWGSARRKAAEAYRGIHFANTDLSGVALLEEAFYHGLRAADEVLAARQKASRSLLGG